MNLGVGDVVVYGAHGAGSVTARETRRIHGEQQTVVVLALAGGLSVELPLTRAQQQLRPIVDEDDLVSIERVLREEPQLSKDPWLKRRRDTAAKLRDALGLAEIMRDGKAAESASGGKVASHLSPGERELLRRARQLLVNEIALARGVTLEEAGAWLDARLVR